MASLSITSEPDSMAAFRTALPDGPGTAAIAEKLCAIGASLHLAKGESLAPDAREDRLVHLASGAAKLVAQPQTGALGSPVAQVLAFHFPGDMISVLRQTDGDFRLVALIETDLVVFPAERFLDIAQSNPAVLRSVLARSLQALHRSRTRMMQMGHKSAQQRIADFLVSMAERLADCTTGPCAFSLPMSRRDIGDSLGLTIETVSRQLTELRESGLVETEGRSKVCLSDVGALARLAGRQSPAAGTNSPKLTQI
ncbi:MAG: helix-turn-helix domain-containing protein [Erythrobacter sp.]|jgi:CRP/FNR family transcriptional regulator|uniref:Crp/Fnr family transcriptional regulator n=1 Tax=Erythrobacter sp. TaxID=1042 RepID=UPI002B4A2F2C|nr:helix-turn-helix domain-containing protein [Erythrobacter sp.]WRH70270.1 MAG: helix-turn-helix domain-containing protein [Erythrobacter sp.]